MNENKIVGDLWIENEDKGEVIVECENLPAENNRDASICLKFDVERKRVTIYISYQDLAEIKLLPDR